MSQLTIREILLSPIPRQVSVMWGTGVESVVFACWKWKVTPKNNLISLRVVTAKGVRADKVILLSFFSAKAINTKATLYIHESIWQQLIICSNRHSAAVLPTCSGVASCQWVQSTLKTACIPFTLSTYSYTAYPLPTPLLSKSLFTHISYTYSNNTPFTSLITLFNISLLTLAPVAIPLTRRNGHSPLIST